MLKQRKVTIFVDLEPMLKQKLLSSIIPTNFELMKELRVHFQATHYTTVSDVII